MEAEAETTSFKKLEAEAEALYSEAEAIQKSPLPHHWFLSNGSVGDDDLWYHRILETLCSLFLHPPPPRVPPSWL